MNIKKKTKTAAVLFSGGKDSCLALLKAKNAGYHIKYLLSISPKSADSWMYHKPDKKIFNAQVKMLKIPLITQKSSKKEKEVGDLKKLIKKVRHKINTLVIGGIASSYQGKRIKKIADELGIEIFAPLWNYSSIQLWDEILKNNLKVILIKISCEGIPKQMLGVPIDSEQFARLKNLSERYKFDLSFEGGEAETAVLCMPGFEKGIKLDRFGIKSEGQYRHFLIVKKLSLK